MRLHFTTDIPTLFFPVSGSVYPSWSRWRPRRAEEFQEMMFSTFRYPVSAIRNRFEFVEKGTEVYAKT